MVIQRESFGSGRVVSATLSRILCSALVRDNTCRRSADDVAEMEEKLDHRSLAVGTAGRYCRRDNWRSRRFMQVIASQTGQIPGDSIDRNDETADSVRSAPHCSASVSQ